jgi:hypothetical protein
VAAYTFMSQHAPWLYGCTDQVWRQRPRQLACKCLCYLAQGFTGRPVSPSAGLMCLPPPIHRDPLPPPLTGVLFVGICKQISCRLG